ncbi:MAG: phosphotransferase [Nanobdellota archaeon]
MDMGHQKLEKICAILGDKYLSHSFLSRGCHNDCFKLDMEDRQLVLRVVNNNEFDNLGHEMKMLEAISGTGLGPKVELLDESGNIMENNYMVEEFIEGQHIHPTNVDETFIRDVAMAYKKLHNITTNTLPEFTKQHGKYSLLASFNSLGWAQYNQYRHMFPASIRDVMDDLFNETYEILKKSDDIFSERENFPLLHWDAQWRNIISTDEGIKFVDWEFSRYDVEEKELGCFAYSFQLDQQSTGKLVQAYTQENHPGMLYNVNLMALKHCTYVMGWRARRLYSVKEGRVDPRQYCSTESSIIKEIQDDLPNAEYLLKFLK